MCCRKTTDVGVSEVVAYDFPMQRHLAPVAALVVLAPVWYALAYLALLVPEKRFGSIPGYRISAPAVTTFFRPANWIDRKIRPDYWSLIEFSTRANEIERRLGVN